MKTWFRITASGQPDKLAVSGRLIVLGSGVVFLKGPWRRELEGDGGAGGVVRVLSSPVWLAAAPAALISNRPGVGGAFICSACTWRS